MPSCLSYLSEAHHKCAGAYPSTCAEDRVRRWARPLPVLTALCKNKNGLVNSVGYIKCPSPSTVSFLQLFACTTFFKRLLVPVYMCTKFLFLFRHLPFTSVSAFYFPPLLLCRVATIWSFRALLGFKLRGMHFWVPTDLVSLCVLWRTYCPILIWSCHVFTFIYYVHTHCTHSPWIQGLSSEECSRLLCRDAAPLAIHTVASEGKSWLAARSQCLWHSERQSLTRESSYIPELPMRFTCQLPMWCTLLSNHLCDCPRRTWKVSHVHHLVALF